jgi:DNA polymerase III subunit epsilon
VKRILWNDLETTGTDPHKHAIIQIAAIIEENGVIIDTFESKMRPLPGKEIDETALEVNGVTREELLTFLGPNEVYSNFRMFCLRHGKPGDKSGRFIPAGYNNGFDLDFMAQWHLDMENKFAFWHYLQYQPIDPYPVCVALWRAGIMLTPDVKLPTVAKYYGIELKPHDAMSDVLAAREVSKRVLLPFLSHTAGCEYGFLGPVNPGVF